MFENKSMDIFSSRDKIRTQLIEYAKQYLELDVLDLTKASYMSYLINILSVLTTNLIYYNTAVYREFFLTRAQQKESVLNLAAMVGYVPSVANPATGSILITMPTDFSSSVELVFHGRHDDENQPFKFYAGSTPFSCENEVRVKIVKYNGVVIGAQVEEINKLSGGIKPVNWRFDSDKKNIFFMVTVTQVEDIDPNDTKFNFPRLTPYQFYDKDIKFKGDFAGIRMIVRGVENRPEEIQLPGIGRTIQTKEYYINPEEWVPKASLFLITPGEAAFSYRINENGMKLFFGNGVIGTQPQENYECVPYISITEGSKGNVLSGSINKSETLYVTETINGKIVRKPVKMTVINPSPTTGGRDYPSIDEIRKEAIIQVSTNKRLVSQYDNENVSSIVGDLPIQHSIPILKRSDLKRNEICLFTDIVFNDTYVPTRNEKITISDSSMFYDSDAKTYEIRFGDIIFEDEDGSDFCSLFDIKIDEVEKTCTYFYLLNELEKEITLKQTVSPTTIIMPSTCTFITNKNEKTCDITVYFQKLNDDPIYDNLICSMEIGERGVYEYMTFDSSSDEGYNFSITKDISDLDDGEVTYSFRMYYSNSGVNSMLCEMQVSSIVKQSLDEFMYSKIIRNTEDETWTLYDVPVVLDMYINELVAPSDNSDPQIDTFIDQVINRIVTFDVTQYRMTTDFINLKFSNTCGKLTNMKYHKPTKGIIDYIDPDNIVVCCDGKTYAVTNDINYWTDTHNRTRGGFLAKYNATAEDWYFIDLRINDIVIYKKPFLTDQNVTDYEDIKLIYNGHNLVEMTRNIPLDVEIDIWLDPSYSASEQAIIDLVKKNVTEYQFYKMGYDKPVYRSELGSVVQTTPGVLYCSIRKPEHDIFFKYDFRKFTQLELLEYSPQLVYIDSNHMTINVRK